VYEQLLRSSPRALHLRAMLGLGHVALADDVHEHFHCQDPPRAVVATMDTKRPRLVLNGTMPKTADLQSDTPGVAALLQAQEPCIVFVNVGDAEQTVTAEKNLWVVVQYMPDDAPAKQKTLWATAGSSVAAAISKQNFAIATITTVEEFTTELLVNTGKAWLNKATPAKVGDSPCCRGTAAEA